MMQVHKTIYRLEKAMEQPKVVHWTCINLYITYFRSSLVFYMLQAVIQKRWGVSMDEYIDKPISRVYFSFQHFILFHSPHYSITNHF